MQPCTFCNLTREPIAANASFVAIFDAYPVNKGHALIVSRRHVPDLFSLAPHEFTQLHDAIMDVRRLLDAEFTPDGYNVGANCGAAAGQTIDHFHLHMIPRYRGDVEKPRGGIRNIKPPLREY